MDAASPDDHAEIEKAISACVEDFYANGRKDPLLSPIFNAAVGDWDARLRIVADFWSHALLKTECYTGSPFPAHTHLPIEPEHFPRWLELFEASAPLPPRYAEDAIARARLMTRSFICRIFPFTDKGGKPARRPA